MTKYMTVIKINSDKSESFETIDLLDVDFIEMEKRRITYFIGEQKYYHISNKTELESFLKDSGFNSLDRPNLVNLYKIRKFDSVMGKVFFEKEPTKKSIFATVAKIKYPFVKSIIEKIVEFNRSDTNREVTADLNKLKAVIKGLLKKHG